MHAVVERVVARERGERGRGGEGLHRVPPERRYVEHVTRTDLDGEGFRGAVGRAGRRRVRPFKVEARLVPERVEAREHAQRLRLVGLRV